jgi:hypothetical protein
VTASATLTRALPEAPVASQARPAPCETASPSEPNEEASDPWWRQPDAWITPAVAVVVIVLVSIVLVLSAIA